MNLVVSIDDTATRAIANSAQIVTSSESLTAGGRRLRESIIANLNSKGPNSRFPGATTNFWSTAAKSVTQPMVSGRETTVSITKTGVRYNYFGGTIKAPWKNGSSTKYLTIPACEEAYGHRAREFNDLTIAFLGRSPSGAPILALVRNGPGAKGLPRPSNRPLALGSAKTTASRKQAEGTVAPKKRLDVMYWLVTESTKQPDPTVLPGEETMKAAFTRGIRGYLAGRLRNSKVLPEA